MEGCTWRKGGGRPASLAWPVARHNKSRATNQRAQKTTNKWDSCIALNLRVLDNARAHALAVSKFNRTTTLTRQALAHQKL